MKYLHILYTSLFGVAVLLFFGLAYPHHLHYQEQFQLFLLCLGGGSNYWCIARTGATSDIPASTMVNGQWSIFNVQCL